MYKRSTAEEQHLYSVLQNHIPIEILRKDYQTALGGRVVVVDKGRFISRNTLSKFLCSEECQALNKQYEHMVSLRSSKADGGDSDYVERNPRYKD